MGQRVRVVGRAVFLPQGELGGKPVEFEGPA